MRNVLVVTLSTGVLATACGHHSAAAPGGWIEVHDVAAGVALRMPAGWHVHRHGNWCMRGGPGVITLSRAQRSPDGESVSVFRGRRVWFVNAYLGGDVSRHDPTLEAIVRTIRFNR